MPIALVNLANVRRRAPASRDTKVDKLNAVFSVDHDVVGFKVAVDNAMRMDVTESITDPKGDPDSAIHRERLLAVENFPERPTLDPLHCHVNPALILIRQDLYDARMVELSSDLRLAMETIVKERVALHFGVRHFDGYRISIR